MQRLRVPAIATAIAVAACAATQARAATLATLHDASQLAAGAGLAVWSAHDAATERYQLTAQMPDGRVAPLPVDPAPAAFPVAVGATSAGALVVDARCAHEPRDITSGPPADQATGCRLEAYDTATGQVRTLRIAAPAGDVIFAPAIAGDRIAFGYVKPGEHRPRIAVAPLDGSTPAHEVARGPLRFCTRRPFAARLRRLCSTGKDVSLDGLALDGDRLAFAWSYYGYSAGGPTYRSELYVEDLARTAAPRLVARATGDANGQPRYSAPALGDGTLAALLTCRGGPACTVQPPRVQRIGLSRHSVAEAPLGATTLAASVRAAYAGGLRRGVALGPPG